MPQIDQEDICSPGERPGHRGENRWDFSKPPPKSQKAKAGEKERGEKSLLSWSAAPELTHRNTLVKIRSNLAYWKNALVYLFIYVAIFPFKVTVLRWVRDAGFFFPLSLSVFHLLYIFILDIFLCKQHWYIYIYAWGCLAEMGILCGATVN